MSQNPAAPPALTLSFRARLVVFALGLQLRLISLVSKRQAGRSMFRIFSTPRSRRPVPKKAFPVMERAEQVELKAGRHRLAAYRWKPSSEASGAARILLVHGWESRAARLTAWIDPLLEQGFEVVAFDAPGHGLSEGRRSDPLAFIEAIAAVTAALGPIDACVGHSLGGLSALLAVAGPRPCLLDVQRMVIVAGAESGVDAMSMFCRILGLGDRHLAWLLDAASEESGMRVEDCDAHRIFVGQEIPTLWLHDPEDREVPYSGAQKVAEVCPHVELRPMAGLGHHRIVRDPGVVQSGVDFLKSLRELSRPAA